MRRGSFGTWFSAAAVAVLRSAAAQNPVEPPPSVAGQWEGPYTLVQIADEHAVVPLGEITHAMVLPDPLGEVMFWCRNAVVGVTAPDPLAHGGAWGPTHTYIWHPYDPQRATQYDVPNAMDGSQDFFCNGHQFLANGDPIAFGGTDLPKLVMAAQPYGHVAAARFDLALRQWMMLPSLTMSRWYPHGFLTADGQLTVLGHTSQPDDFPDGSNVFTVQHNDFIADTGTGTFTRSQNRRYGSGAQPCGGSSDPTTFVPVLDYPRAFVLGLENMLLYAVLRLGLEEHRFLDFNVDCTAPSAGTFKHPWHTYQPSFAEPHTEGSAAHFFFLGAGSVPSEVIYAAGGELSSTMPVASVERLMNPSVTALTPWTDVDDLILARTHLTLIIGALGDLYAMGGLGLAATGGLIPVLAVERCRPEEIFGTPSTWTLMAAHAHGRTYHSVAGLLPDGRIFLAGGEEPGSHHTVEIFKPAYLFIGPRPVVDNVLLPQNWAYASQRTFDFTARQGVTYARAHLIKLGSITHGFDSSQRFVALELDQQTQIGPNKYQIRVNTPLTAAIAPAGHYMLFAVDSAGVPSVAQIVHLP